ncbi:MAG: formylmethanofuran dehydrogenase subunit A [Candidatus Nezhaarchaeales archaeon]
MQLLIKNGIVFDPVNNVKGERMDIAIRDGKIVSDADLNVREAKVIDAEGRLVMAGGVDMHSHIAGPKLNSGRIMRPEDHYKSFMKLILNVRRSGSGRTTPSTNVIGYKYARMGWTTVFEPATPPLKTRHTHEELDDIPILDKACFPLFDSNLLVLDYVEQKDYEKLKALVAWLLEAVKGWAIKIVDPGVAEAWAWGKGIGLNLDDIIPGRNTTPREIVRALCTVNESLKLPHPIHVHCNRLGFPGNYEVTIKTMDAVSDLYVGQERPIIHITHVQFTGYAGTGWANLDTGADDIADYVNTHKHVSLDLGQVVFGDATTMTADAPFEFVLFHLAPGKWTGAEVEGEAASGIVPYRYRKSNYVNSIQWCIGLEVALLVRDPWRVFPTTDHPNAGPFTRYPEVIAWLMSKKARDAVLAKINRRAAKKAILPTIDREYDFYEVAVCTRAGQAKILGLKNKGHLGIGADADVAIYDIKPLEVDPSRQPEEVIKAFRRAYYTIKAGEIVVKEGEVVRHVYGSTFYVKPKVEPDLLKVVMSDVEPKFKSWYSVSLSNYVISERELRHPLGVAVGG